MAGVEEQRGPRTTQGTREIAKLAVERRLVDIGGRDHLEAKLTQRRGHVVGVVRRIGQLDRVLVGAVADDEGDALMRRRKPIRRSRPDQDEKAENPMSAIAGSSRPLSSPCRRGHDTGPTHSRNCKQNGLFRAKPVVTG